MDRPDNQYGRNIGDADVTQLLDLHSEEFGQQLIDVTRQKERQFIHQGRARDSCMMGESAGAVWLAFKRRRPEGLIEGPNPPAYFDRTCQAETLKASLDRRPPRHPVTGEPAPFVGWELDFPSAMRGPEEEVADRESRELIRSSIQVLDDADRELIEVLFGLGRDERTVSEIAAARGVTPQAIRQRSKRICDRLRDPLVQIAP
jgi:DNA-directed RNA polymerase specialized sigma24 family protein